MILKINDLIIPKGIKYLGDWKEFNFSLFPSKCILDKVIPGCGFTEYCITGKENVILCSPRKMLLENKYDQHEGEVYLVRNELEIPIKIDRDIEKPDKSRVILQNPTDEEKKKVYDRIYTELEYFIRMNDIYSKPSKILVTYDSYHIVKDILISMGVFDKYYTIIDEFQSLISDSKFKSSTEISFLSNIQDSPTSIFVSATPIMEKYLNIIDEFDQLPYIRFDWITEDSGRITKPKIVPLTMMSVGTKCKEIIDKFYKSEKFEKVTTEKGEVESKEAVFYVNSVNHIINVINKCSLKPEEVNILCSNTDYNQRKLDQKFGKGVYKIGKVPNPKKGEINKMFTFCTRTVYLGADFYSKCARSFIFSDANIDTLVVDISEDLAQILGRQRDLDNPWKNTANFYYKSTKNFRKVSQEDFNKRVEEKKNSTKSLLSAYENVSDSAKPDIAKKYERFAQVDHYKDDYVAVNSKGIPVINMLAMISEIRAYEIQQLDYADRVSIFARLKDEDIIENTDEIENRLLEYNNISTLKEKLRYICCNLSDDIKYEFLKRLENGDRAKSYVVAIGLDRIKASGYETTKLDTEISNQILLPQIDGKVYSKFKEGDYFFKSDLKQKLQEIYDEAGIKQIAKAVDLDRWFELQTLKLKDNTGKRINGIKLGNKKRN